MHLKIAFFYILFVAADLIWAVDVVDTAEVSMDVAKGNCSCGGFATETPRPEELPVIAQSPGFIVQCDPIGADLCKSLCLALATAAKAKGPEVICGKIGNANELKLSAFYRICEGPWTFTGMTSDRLLCCEDAKAKVCPCNAPATSSVPPKATTI